jgi:hypothetical protein
VQPQDKLIERDRYDALSKAKREHLNPLEEPIIGAASLPPYLRSPYLFYE